MQIRNSRHSDYSRNTEQLKSKINIENESNRNRKGPGDFTAEMNTIKANSEKCSSPDWRRDWAMRWKEENPFRAIENAELRSWTWVLRAARQAIEVGGRVVPTNKTIEKNWVSKSLKRHFLIKLKSFSCKRTTAGPKKSSSEIIKLAGNSSRSLRPGSRNF